MKAKQGLNVILVAAASILFFSTIFLIKLSNHYRNVNRQLILENDSILAVNIDLRDTLKKKAGAALSVNDGKN